MVLIEYTFFKEEVKSILKLLFKYKSTERGWTASNTSLKDDLKIHTTSIIEIY